MFVTVVAVLCKLAVAHATIAPDRDCTAEETRIEEIVTDSSMDDHLDFFSCQVHGQIGVADWKSKNPLYHGDQWRVARVKCAPGHYEIRGRA
jgi:hypothetical protein